MVSHDDQTPEDEPTRAVSPWSDETPPLAAHTGRDGADPSDATSTGADRAAAEQPFAPGAPAGGLHDTASIDLHDTQSWAPPVAPDPGQAQRSYEQAYRNWYAQYGEQYYAQQSPQFPRPPVGPTPPALVTPPVTPVVPTTPVPPTATPPVLIGAGSGAYGGPGVPPIGPGSPYGTGPAGAPTPKPARPGVARLVALAVVVGLVAGGGAGAAAGWALDRDDASVASSSYAPPLQQTADEVSPPADGSVAAVAAAVSPAVVSIQVESSQGTATGSGSIIRSDGYILTNNHVIAGGGTVTVFFQDGTKADGEVVGSNADYDLAVVKVDKTGLPVLAIGDSDALSVGDTVIAIGSPLGLSGTVTAGIVSALDRPVTTGDSQDPNSETSYISAIQTDAAINPGNSGGALVNASGQLVGVPSAIATETGGSVGLGFAIPMAQAKRIAEEIINTGSSTTPIIGVQLGQDTNVEGALIQSVDPGGPAADAGVQDGDVVTKVNGKIVNDSTEFIVALRSEVPGAQVTLTVDRNGSTEELTVTLGSRTE